MMKMSYLIKGVTANTSLAYFLFFAMFFNFGILSAVASLKRFPLFNMNTELQETMIDVQLPDL